MKDKLLRTSLVASLLTLLLTGCNAVAGPPDQSATTSPPVRIVHADLASGVASVAQLATSSQLAVLATAKASAQEVNEVDPTLVATVESFTIDELVWGQAPADGLNVKFTGGVVDDNANGRYLLQVDGQPQFDEGQQYFLILLGPSPDGTYMVLGGPQGRYELNDGRLHAVKGTETDPIIASLDGRDFSAATQELKQNLKQ